MEKVYEKIQKYKKLAAKKPKYYVSIGDLYSDDGDFKTATIYYQKAVDNGVLAYTVLGDTWGYRSQYKKAFDVYTEGANKGEAECFARLGFCYETGYVKIDIQKAIECYAKASDLGVAAAARSLGELYYFNTPIEDSEIENVKNALKYYERAFYLGDIEVAKKIGFIYLNNEELKDVPKAIEWYEKGLSLGDHSLNFDLAYVYLNDRFVPHDYEKGLNYLSDGVKHDDPESLYMQARIYEEGWYGIEPDKKKYIHYLKKAAKLFQDDALFDLGYYYYNKDRYDDALDCFIECDLNDARVYWAIATILEVKKKDYKNALRYYQMAAEMDFPDAIERMAEAYLGDELGLKKNEKTALKLFIEAAERDNAAAQYNLGMAYACGYYGLTADREAALHWLKKSVQGENPSACLQVGLYYYYTVKTQGKRM
ncbi:MAG: tetratricopeptide repeat protein [Spirochaetales bacterium]|nr:tetratricopeptide repeat protein [Spirochaetales bacterium]